MLKKTQIDFDGKLFSCEISPGNNESLKCKIYQDDFLNFEGKLSLKELYSQIPAFDEYSMEEIFSVLNDIEKDKFEIINSSNQLKLKIMIKVIKKLKELSIILEPKSQSKSEIIQNLLSLVIKNKKRLDILEKQIKEFSDKLKAKTKKKEEEKKLKEAQNKKEKEKEEANQKSNTPKIELSKLESRKTKKIYNYYPYRIIALKDGRLAVGLEKCGVGIVDPDSLDPLFLVESIDCKYFIELNNGKLALIQLTGFQIVKLEGYSYQILQTISNNYYTLGQLSNGTLIANTYAELIFFEEKNNKYTKDFGIKIKSVSEFIIQTKMNEIVFSDYLDYFKGEGLEIIFYNYENKVEKKRFKDIDFYESNKYNIGMISDDLLFLASFGKKYYLINVNNYQIVKSSSFDASINSIYIKKNEYLITCDINSFKLYEIGEDSLNYTNQRIGIDIGYPCFAFIDDGKNGKIFACGSIGKITKYA